MFSFSNNSYASLSGKLIKSPPDVCGSYIISSNAKSLIWYSTFGSTNVLLSWPPAVITNSFAHLYASSIYGISFEYTSAEYFPSNISTRCPKKPNPVISVQLLTLKSFIIWAEYLLSVVICLTLWANASSEHSFTIWAVLIILTPKGFVTINKSPTLQLLFCNILSGWTTPVTDKPYLGVASWIECPPARTPPASCTFSAPPFNIWCKISKSIFSGKATIFKAEITSPPIAYTSLSALVAAICPYKYGSFIIVVKKSNVWIIALSSDIL